MNVPPNLDDLKKLIKQENQGTGRLASLNPVRDLSLSVPPSKPKKTYVPNLNIVRNKDRVKQIQLTSRDTRPKRKIERPNQKEAKQPRFLQTEGVFSQGIADIKRPNQNEARGYSLRERDSLSSMVMPKINKNTTKVSGSGDSVLNDFIAQDDSDSESDYDHDPVVIPLKHNQDNFVKTFKVKPEDNWKIKDEPEEGNFFSAYSCTAEFKPDRVTEEDLVSSCFTSENKFYDEDHPCISIIKLPSTFSEKSFSEEGCKNPTQLMDEGQIGTIRIRKSGKMEVSIRNMTYNLDKSDSPDYEENVVILPGKDSISIEPSVVTLASINEKFAMGLNWKELFVKAKQSKRRYYW